MSGDIPEKPETYTVGFSQLNQALDCLMQIRIWMEEATEAIEQVMDAVLDTLSPSVADQLALLQEANPEAFEELRKQVVEGEVDGGIATHVADVIDLETRRKMPKNQGDLYFDE